MSDLRREMMTGAYWDFQKAMWSAEKLEMWKVEKKGMM
jgi:hypothetical protein